MGVPGSANLLLLGGEQGYKISRSLRFNSADSAYLNRTPASAGNRRTFTWSGWIKFSSIGVSSNGIFEAATNSSNRSVLVITGNSQLQWFDSSGGSTVTQLVTSQVFRDFSAWYHIVVAVDTTQATSSNRVKIYVNGSQVTAFGTATYPSQNFDTQVNAAVATVLGAGTAYTPSAFYDGYLTEINFIDGQALTPSSFGETDILTGVWKPKRYAGTYGTNGFYLNFSDDSGNTATTIGKDYSGNGNNWTPNNIGVVTSSASITHGTQRENDYRSATLITGLTGYSTITLNCSYSWSGNLGGTLTQTVSLRNSSNTVVATGSGSGSSGSFTVTGTGLSTGMTYNVFVEATSTGGSYMERTASITVNYSADGGTATTDSMIDTPTPYADGGNGRGNYCTGNPLYSPSSNSRMSLTNGNLEWGQAAINATSSMAGTFEMRSGKWYWEVTAGGSFNWSSLGIQTTTNTAWRGSGTVLYRSDGQKVIGGTNSAYGSSFTTNDVIGFAYDADAGSLTCYKNNTSQGVIYSSGTGNVWVPCAHDDNAGAGVTYYHRYNFGQRPFAYTPPSGFVALNTQNLPEPSIKKPSAYMDVLTWTGNGSTSFTSPTLAFSPDLVWTKKRSGATYHEIYDSVRGAGNNKELSSNATDAEGAGNADIYGYLSSFNSNSFSASGGTDAVYPIDYFNANAATYVAWCWDESATPGFDIVTYTGTGSNTTIAHNLGVAPKMMIIKARNSAGWLWAVYHASVGNTGYLRLNATDAVTTSSSTWQNTSPTSTVFSIGTDGHVNFNSSTNYVAYLWSEVAGFSKFGSYTGNGSSDGPFCFCGFRPRFVMFKRTDSTGSWFMEDSARGTYNVMGPELYANLSDAETTVSRLDFLSNGFKMRAANAGDNASGGTYVFAAFSESPFKYSLAR